MHNQDQTKDDVMEAIFELLKKLEELLFKSKKESQKELTGEKETKDNLDDRIVKFKDTMKEIMDSDASNKLKDLAKTFYENPLESMKMLQAVVVENSAVKYNELTFITQELIDELKNIRSTINMDNENSLEQLTVVNKLIKGEQVKKEFADQSILDIGNVEKYREDLKSNENRIKEIHPSKDDIDNNNISPLISSKDKEKDHESELER